MTTVDVNASTRYNVHIGKGLIDKAGEMLCEITSPCAVAVISDDKVFPIYGERVIKSLEKCGFSTVSYTFKNGEQSKNLHTFADILEFLADSHLTRTDMVIALGGGVVGDMAGFCAATYLRGIRFVQIPTTILAACDSSVGGKTAVDLAAGKNLAGAFHQPSLVICDTDTFNTLDERQVACGFAEIIKYGIICDKELFRQLEEKQYDIDSVITRCVQIKRDIVERDEKESGDRKLLNLGHTLGHAVEKHSNFSLTHGEAVAVGLMMIAKLSEALGIGTELVAPIGNLLKKYSLPLEYSITPQELFDIAAGDKKVDRASITLVIPSEIGKCELKKATLEDFREMLVQHI